VWQAQYASQAVTDRAWYRRELARLVHQRRT
jgi:hypothetical protein